MQDTAESTIGSLSRAADERSQPPVESLFTVLYRELHRLARRELSRGLPVTISATTLLHETYLDLAKRDHTSFLEHAQFIKYASRVMRGLVIDHMRSRHAQKRGGQFELTPYNPSVQVHAGEDRDLADLSDALDELASLDPTLSQTVDLKFFCGFTFAEIGAMQGLAERTVQRNWSKARLYLHQTIRYHVPR
jgi:RNA polymerase sigma factor (TIGR02999 family)